LTTSKERTSSKIAPTRVIKRQEITDDLWLMWVEKPKGFSFKAGQYCTLGVNGIERAYSIVSAPYEDLLELFVELVPPPEGRLTPLLYELHEGDMLSIRPRAKGIFTFDAGYANQLFVATVTGVVPYISIIRQYIHDQQTGHHLYALVGASYQDEHVYSREFQRISCEAPDFFDFVPTISRPQEERNAGWTGETGRVNTIVERSVEKWGLPPGDTLIYACGNPGMIEDVKARMTPRGFAVKEERFWKDD
jgi:NAD(P)H-flavin reductase